MNQQQQSVLTVVVRALSSDEEGKLVSCHVAPDGHIGEGHFVLQVLDVPEQNILVLIAVDMRLLEPGDFQQVVEGASDYIDNVLDNLRVYGYETTDMNMGLWQDAIDDAFSNQSDDESESE